MLRINLIHSQHYYRLKKAFDAGWTFAGGKGGGATVQTQKAELPDELKPLFASTANLIQGFQPLFKDFFSSTQNFGGLQIAPLSPLEQEIQNVAQGAGTAFLRRQPGFFTAADVLDLDRNRPIINLAQTPIAPTQAEAAGVSLISDVEPRLNQRIGQTPEELSSSMALSLLPAVAQTGIPTPGAESTALNELDFLTSGPLGSSPATRQGINFLEQQFTTRDLPLLENTLATAGLGRSGALEQGITDLRGKLFGAEVPLLQQEVADRLSAARELQGIAGLEQTRSDLPTSRLLQALNQQAGGFAGLGGQLAGRQEADLARQIATEEGLFRDLLPAAQFQRESQTIPIDRAIQTALNTAGAFGNVGQGQIAFADALSKVASLPRELQQQANLADLQRLLRVQSLAEAGTTGILGAILPSSIGQSITGSTSSGRGIFGIGK